MDSRFLAHNTHLDDFAHFERLDPHLRALKKLPLVHTSSLLCQLPGNTPGIFSLTGGRQVGKTTFLKQWMSLLLKKGHNPGSIAFLTGELIDDHHQLVRLIQDVLSDMPTQELRHIILDEVSYIRDWDKGIKVLADAGDLENCAAMITGSDLALIDEARKRFPGRRGRAPQVDFHLYPLSFREVVSLKAPTNQPPGIETLLHQWDEYLLHGGFLSAINDFVSTGTISTAILRTYSDWIRGDVQKRGKSEQFLLEILGGIVKRYGSQITWLNLSKDLSIDHPQTVADYVALLEKMDVLFTQHALNEEKLTGAPKKARKVIFNDPFIFHAIVHWLKPINKPFEFQMQTSAKDPEMSSRLVEAAVVSHYRRYFPTFYIKAAGEVDVVYVKGKRFFPIEVKWSKQIRPKDLRQIRKYPHAQIIGKQIGIDTMHGIPYEPLPFHLWKLDGTATHFL